MSAFADSGFDEPPLDYTPPPAGDARERLCRLRLVRSRRVGPATYLRLMAEHGQAELALAALPEIARAAGVEDYDTCPEPVAAAEIAAARRVGARMLCLGDPDYPALLARIGDAPPVLWAMGRTDLLDRPTVAIVGTRNASALGARMARRLARDLGEAGYVVVSGLARGIDALAHEAALGSGTVAVHAGGLDVIYPPENAALAGRIGKEGVRLSEMPFGLQPQGRHFPRRNRIVSGLAQAVVVVEAAARSGSMITARNAADQGREVMAVPGHPLDSRASGANMLLRDGATLVRSADDVIEALGGPVVAAPGRLPVAAETAPAPRPVPAAPLPAGGLEALLLDRLSATPSDEDDLIRETGHPPRKVSQALAVLEMAGRISRTPGGRVALTE
jgi:DNA processing protein